MAFSEGTKIEAKRRAHYVCCVCKVPFVEVHHIIPQESGGSDELDNAAPLCARCHRLYGGNPELRKQIRQMRDFWWEHCKKTELVPGLAELNHKFEVLQSGLSTALSEQQKQATMLEEVKQMIASFYLDTAKEVAAAPSLDALTAVSGVSVPVGVLLPPTFGSPAANGRCPVCGSTNVAMAAKINGGASEMWECSGCGRRFTNVVHDYY